MLPLLERQAETVGNLLDHFRVCGLLRAVEKLVEHGAVYAGEVLHVHNFQLFFL